MFAPRWASTFQHSAFQSQWTEGWGSSNCQPVREAVSVGQVLGHQSIHVLRSILPWNRRKNHGNYESRSSSTWLTVKVQLASLPCHPVLLWLHISSSTNAFSFRSTTICSSRVHHGWNKLRKKKENSWKLELVLPGFTIHSKIGPVLDSAASSPSGETAVEKVCCFEKLPYPSWWKDGIEPTQKIRTHRDQIFIKTGKII